MKERYCRKWKEEEWKLERETVGNVQEPIFCPDCKRERDRKRKVFLYICALSSNSMKLQCSVIVQWWEKKIVDLPFSVFIIRRRKFHWMKQFRSFSAWIGLQQPEKLRKSKKAAAGEESKFVTGLDSIALRCYQVRNSYFLSFQFNFI